MPSLALSLDLDAKKFPGDYRFISLGEKLVKPRKISMEDLLSLYLSSHSLRATYVQQLHRTVKCLGEWGISSASDLEPMAVNRWLVDQCERVSRTTVANMRRELLTLWRWAFEMGLVAVPPLRVVRVQAERKPVECWTRAELEAMLAYAMADETKIGGVSSLLVRDVMPAWIGIGFDTAVRFSDILTLEIEDFRHEGTVVAFSAQKTGKPLVRRLSDLTQTHCARLFSLSPDGNLFLWALTRRRATLMWRDFLKRHGMRGSSKWLRRSCATQLAMGRGGAAAATAYLQHSSPHLVHASYIDASQAAVPDGPAPLRPR